MSKQQSDAGTMQGIDKPDDTGVAENTQGTDWDLSSMSAAHIEGSEYRILSTRNNSVTHYRVDVDAGECECPSTVYNLDEHEACPHLAKALTVHTSHMSADEWAVRDLQTLTDRANDLMWDLRDTTDWVETVIESAAAPAASQNVQSNGEMQTPSGETVANVDPEEAAETLQDAYDEQCDGLQAIAHDGKVWPNTTPDAPGYAFEAFIKGKDLIQWDADGEFEHPTVGPSDYELENYIQPKDVNQYIEEVLE